MSLIGQPRSEAMLLGLPRELRDSIFRLALHSYRPLVAFRLDHYQRESYLEAVQPGLTQTNRQVRQESLPIFYCANTFILHSEEPKMVDTQRWLKCIESRLPSMLHISIWLRYVNLAHDPLDSSGAICVSIRRSKHDEAWRVEESWQWVTVTRRPSSLRSDGLFLVKELQGLLADDSTCMLSAQGISSVLIDLKMLYKKEKMS